MSNKEHNRLTVEKTWKLFMGGAFPRSESGRSLEVTDGEGRFKAHVCRSSRKDFRNAVEAAEKAAAGWQSRSGYNRGQILHRMAEMAECRKSEIVDTLMTTGQCSRREAIRETDHTIDRLICFAGWTDKVEQVLGCRNPVAGPYHNMSIPEPIGVVAVVAPKESALLGLTSMIAPALASGNVVVALVSEENPLPGLLLGEVCATSDVPAGVLNLLSGERAELLPHIATHRGLGAVVAGGLSRAQKTRLKEDGVDSLMRINPTMDTHDFEDDAFWTSPRALMPFIEVKTMWHPVGG